MPGSLWVAAAAVMLLCMAAPARGAKGGDDSTDVGYSAIPIAGYDDNSGWLYGAAGFLYSDRQPGVNAGLFVVSNLNDFHSATFNIEQRFSSPWSYSLHLLGEKAFDLYYGEGDLTSPDSPRLIRMGHFEARPAVMLRVRPHLRLGVFGDWRIREEVGSQVFPDEASAAWGAHIDWDTRDKLINTRRGDFFQLDLSRDPVGEGFVLANLDLRRFLRLRRDLTLASRFEAGATQGPSSYLFRFRLGGLDLLRGYKANRFRGDAYFVDQEEFRWILRRWLSVNASVDWGDIRDGAFHQLKLTGQLGLRVGLPPDWGQKLRVDLGIGSDQSTAQIQFGEVF